MDKQTIRQHLNIIANEEVPDVNLLPEIKRQLNKQRHPQLRSMFRVARYAIALMILLLISAGGYALYQITLNDPTIPEDFIIGINEEQTVEGVTVTLEWVYVDAHRATIQYTTNYNRDDVADSESLLQSAVVSLQTANGQTLAPAFGGGGGGNNGNDDTGDVTRTYQSNFDMTALTPTPSDITLTLTVNYGMNTNAPMQGSGGGGGGGSSDERPAQAPSTPEANPIPRTFTFTFTAPVRPEQRASVTPSQLEANGLTISVSNVRYTPSMTFFDLCYETPDSEAGWYPLAYLSSTDITPPEDHSAWSILLDGTSVFRASFAPSPAPLQVNDGQVCETINAMFPVEDGTDNLTITVETIYRQRIDTITDAVIAEEEAYFADAGIGVAITLLELDGEQPDFNAPQAPGVRLVPANNYTQWVRVKVTETPDSMTLAQASNYVADRLFHERASTPVSFDVRLN
ncbi:MAG: hypothetical protein ACFE0Q_10260 [Anaerolineae bacterium]